MAFVDADNGSVNVVQLEPIRIEKPYAVKPVREQQNLERWHKVSVDACGDEPRIYTALVRTLD